MERRFIWSLLDENLVKDERENNYEGERDEENWKEVVDGEWPREERLSVIFELLDEFHGCGVPFCRTSAIYAG
jgi:hypothetical protein